MLEKYQSDIAKHCISAVLSAFVFISEFFTAPSAQDSRGIPPYAQVLSHNSTALTENENQF